MNIHFSAEDEAFRREVATWLGDALTGEFAAVRHRGGPGDESALIAERRAWEKKLAAGGWTCVGWPREHGGRGLSLSQQVIFYEEYARAGGPGRINHMGETLFGPTCIAFGTPEQKARFLPGIVAGETIWCQGYSEPNAGSDLANVQTRARLDGDEWVIDGQKVWTSWAEWADWCFVVTRSDPDSKRHAGLSYLLVPMKQPGVTIRPIRQITGDAEFSEVFYDGARTARENMLGAPGDGWKVAMATLAFERGVSTLGQQMLFRNELEAIIRIAKREREVERPADPPAHRRCLDRPRDPALECAAHAQRRRRALRRGHDPQALLGNLAPQPRRARDGRARPGERHRGWIPVRADAAAAPLPVHAQRHDLRRLEPDPAQPDRRARARPSARAEALR